MNSLGNQPLVNADGSALIAGQFIAGQFLYLVYDGTSFRSLGAASSTAIVGSFTGTLTGMTGATTGTINYRVANGVCTLTALATIPGTSNTTSMGMTGLPVVCQPGGIPQVPSCLIINNGAQFLLGGCSINGGTIAFLLSQQASGFTQLSNAAFTNSGTKGIGLGWTITYPLN